MTEFDFLGYTFKAVYIKCKDGVMRNNFIASVSKTAAKGFRDKIKALEIHKRTGCKIDMIAELLNPMIRGWMNYFGKFNPSAMKNTLQCIERRLIKWAMCKYKSFRGRRRRAEKWLSSIRKREPKLFAHCVLLNDKSRMKGDLHVRFREKFEVKVLLLTRLRGRGIG